MTVLEIPADSSPLMLYLGLAGGAAVVVIFTAIAVLCLCKPATQRIENKGPLAQLKLA